MANMFPSVPYEEQSMVQLRMQCDARFVQAARSKAETIARLKADDAERKKNSEVHAPRPAPRGALHRMLMAYPSYGALCCQLPPVRAVLLPHKGGVHLHAFQGRPYYPEGGRIELQKLRLYDARDRAAPPQGVEYF